VPNFGGFVTNKIGAKVNQISHTFYPPTKQISFNSNLKHNDGLLANHIASSEKISFEKAVTAISLSVTAWNKDLQSKPVQLNNLGSFSLNTEKKIVFEPLNDVNYLTESFGLSNIENLAINRPKQLIKPFAPVVKEKQTTKIPAFIKYAATAAILLTLGFAVYSGSQENKQKEIIASQQKEFQKKIQTATFVISNPLPTINLNVVKEISKPYHIIAGAFQFPENAKKKMNQLKKKGFDSNIVGVNKWGLTQVSFSSFANRTEATNALYKIQDRISEDAWLLIKKLD
jgi:hypothetical protein